MTFAANTAAQQTFTWQGGNANTNWSNGANWVGGSAPLGNGGETLIFPATAASFTAVNDIPTGTNFVAINLASGATPYTLTGNQLLLGISGGNVVNNTAGTNAVNLDLIITNGTIAVSAGSALTVGVLGTNVINDNGTALTLNNAGTLTLNSLISGAGGVTQVTGGGSTLLNGTNTYNGTTTISNGTVVLGNANALGNLVGITTVGASGTLDLNGLTLTEPLGTVANLTNSSATPAAIATTNSRRHDRTARAGHRQHHAGEHHRHRHRHQARQQHAESDRDRRDPIDFDGRLRQRQHLRNVCRFAGHYQFKQRGQPQQHRRGRRLGFHRRHPEHLRQPASAAPAPSSRRPAARSRSPARRPWPARR